MARLWLCLRFRFCRCLLERVFFCFSFAVLIFCIGSFAFCHVPLTGSHVGFLPWGVPVQFTTRFFLLLVLVRFAGGRPIAEVRSYSTAAWEQHGDSRGQIDRLPHEARDERQETRGERREGGRRKITRPSWTDVSYIDFCCLLYPVS